MTFDVNLLVGKVAKEDPSVVDDEGHFALGVGLPDDCCPDALCCGGRSPAVGVQMTIF